MKEFEFDGRHWSSFTGINTSSGINTAGLPVSLTWGLRHNFCCRGLILIPVAVLESPAQTIRVNVLDFFVKPKTEFLRLSLKDAK